MKKLSALILAGTLVVPSVFAATITVSTEGGGGYGPYQTGVGGEFTLTINDSSLISGYAASTHNVLGGNDVSFQTFCVEGPEYIYPNATYTANKNNVTMFGGVTLTVGASYLYSQFATGNLAGYNYTGNRTGTAGQLQNALWALMGGQEGQTAANNASNPFLQAAEAACGGTFATATASDLGNSYGVYVLNMWDTSGKAAQDQLIYTGPGGANTTVPDGGMTVILLGMGLTGLGFVSRRLRR